MASKSSSASATAYNNGTNVVQGLAFVLVVSLGGSATIYAMVPMKHYEKPKKFNEVNFKR